MTKHIDTVISNEAFFSRCIDTSFPGFEGIDKLYETDPQAAFAQFAKALKASLQIERFWSKHYSDLNITHPGSVFGSTFTTLPGEDAEAVARRTAEDTYISCEIPHHFEDGVKFYHNPTPNGYREWTWQLNRHPEWSVLAGLYRKTGNEEYAALWKRLIFTFMEQMPAPGNVGSGETDGWRTIEIGIRCSRAWMHALFSFIKSPLFTDEEWVKIMKLYYENAKRLREHPTCGNWLIMEMNGLIHCSILLPFLSEAAEWRHFAEVTMKNQLTQQIYDDGFQFELSTEYHQAVILNYLWVVELYQTMDLTPPQDIKNGLEAMYSLYPKLSRPDMRLPDLNDGRIMDITEAMRAALPLWPERQDFRYFATARKEGTPPDFTSICLDTCGMAVFRSGWEANDFWCFFEAAPFGFGHQHEDKLNVLLYAYGKEMLVEAGCNAYDASPRHVYALSSQGHNTVIVDGHTQCRRPHYTSRSIRLHESAGMFYRDTDAFACAEGTFDETYGENAKEVKHNRRILYMKNPDYAVPFILVIDRLYGDGNSHTYESLWHYADHPYTVDGQAVQLNFGDGVTLSTLTAGFDSLEMVRGRQEPFQGFLASHNVDEVLPIPTAVYAKQTAGDFRSVTVHIPCKNTDCPILSVKAGSNVDDTTVVLTTAKGEITLCETDFFS